MPPPPGTTPVLGVGTYRGCASELKVSVLSRHCGGRGGGQRENWADSHVR